MSEDKTMKKLREIRESKKENKELTKENAREMCGPGEWNHFIAFINDESNEIVHLVGFITPPLVPDVVHVCREMKSDEEFGLEPMNILNRLDRWHYQEKGHAVRLDIDTGYGATCWVCELYSFDTRQMITVPEVSFFAKEDGTNDYIVTIPDDWCEEWKRGWTQFYAHVNERGWSGPNQCIELALFIAEKEGI